MVQVGDDPACGGFYMFFSVTHSNTQAGGLKHGNIIIRIAQRDDLFRGNAQFITQDQQPGTFIDSAC